MDDMNDDLNEIEKIEQENFLLKSKIILKNGHFSESSEIDPVIENQFLKNVMAFEEAEQKPVYEILRVNPDDFPPVRKLTEEEIISKLEVLLNVMAEHNFSCDLSDRLPEAVVYNYLTQDFLLSNNEVLPEGWVSHIDGCDGDCPGCFQVDYCTNKDDIWPADELAAEIQRRKLEEEGE